MKLNNAPTWMFALFGIILIGCQGEPGAFKKRVQQIHAQQQQQIKDMRLTQQQLNKLDDSSKIVYVDMVNDQTQLFTMTSSGEEKKQLTQDSGYKSRPTWSLDHKQIAFFHYQDDQPISDYVSVSIIHADGSNSRRVVNNKKIDTKKIRISWHPKGHIIYFQEKDFPAMLFGYNTSDGEQAETIRLPKQTFMTEAHTLSPNLQVIAGAGPSKKEGRWHIGTVNRDGTMDTDLMMPFKSIDFHLGTVVWSYRSDLIAFELDKIIMILSSKIKLNFKAYPVSPQDFNTQLAQPAISPSGKKLAAVVEKTEEGNRGSGDSVVKSNIVVMNIDGSKQIPITTSGTCFDPHW